MGYLRTLDIRYYQKKFRLDAFVETGTYLGAALDHALNFPFARMDSIEINPQFYNDAMIKYQDYPQINLYLGNSAEQLDLLLPELVHHQILFWLDAHLPQVYDSQRRDLKTEIPLEHELEIIRKHRGKNPRDVLLIDDLRLYEDGPFGSGSWEGRHEFGTDGIGFIHKLFDDTHQITRDFRDEGYVMITPKTA